MTPHRLYVGCVGEGVFLSLDHGITFCRACDGMPFVECDVRALLVDPVRPEMLYVGNEEGVFVSRDGAESWRQLAHLRGQRVWSLNVDARRPGRLLAGVSPAGILRSEDGGESWHRAEACMQGDCPRIRHTRVTCVVSDTDNPDRLWAGVEIDGVHESTDGGRSWSRVGEGLSSQDIHGLAVVPGGPGVKRLLATTNRFLNASDDGGRTWRPVEQLDLAVPWNYTRALAQKAGSPEGVFLGAGDGPPGSEGAIVVSRDAGRTWARSPTPALANSTIWNYAVHQADPGLIYASSVSGEVYRSTDGGRTWGKLAREFGEVRGLAWAPA
jgi:photosystem II stability/assembly factor-like uncharacterized protein